MKEILEKHCTPTVYVGEYIYCLFVFRLLVNNTCEVLTTEYKHLVYFDKSKKLEMFINSLK